MLLRWLLGLRPFGLFLEQAPPVAPAPPPPGVPLDQTTAPIHYEGDTSSV